MPRALHILPPFEWRGELYPVIERNASFAHESVQHKLQRRNKDLVEQIGAHNLVLTYTIPLRTEINKGPYEDLFPIGLNKLLRDFRNKKPGTLVDPLYGPFRCVPTSWTDETDVQKTDGTDVRLEFRVAPEDEEDEDIVVPTTGALVEASQRLDITAQQLGEAAETERQQVAVQALREAEENRPGTDILSAINGFGRQILGIRDRYLAQAENLAHRARKIEETAEEFQDAFGWSAERDARRSRDQANQILSGRQQVQPVRVRTVDQPQSMTSLAAKYGLTVLELMEANPQLTKSPIVPSGARLVIPESSNA